MKKTQMQHFISKEIEDLEEKAFVWQINVYASSGQFDLVLAAKWKIANLYQQGGSI